MEEIEFGALFLEEIGINRDEGQIHVGIGIDVPSRFSSFINERNVVLSRGPSGL